MTSQTVIDEIVTITESLGACSSLAPSPVVNNLLTRLVDIVLMTPPDIASSVMSSVRELGIVARLQHYAMTAETALEFSYAYTYDTSSALTWNDIEKFPYYACYQTLTTLELKHLGVSASPVLFIGGGPLPLSALIMAHEYNRSVTIVDTDVQAVEAARRLVSKLQLEHLISVVTADARVYVSDTPYIILAAMVGGSGSEKKEIVDSLFRHTSPETTMVVRDVVGLAELLYVPHETSGYWVEHARDRHPDSINCIHIWKKV